MDKFFEQILNNFLESISPGHKIFLGISTILLISINAFPTSSYPNGTSELFGSIIPWIHTSSFISFLILFLGACISYKWENYKRHPEIARKGIRLEHYRRLGWGHFDIPLNQIINDQLGLSFEVVLAKPNQDGVLYFRFKANDDKAYWIGFAFNTGDRKNFITDNEYTKNNDVQGTRYKEKRIKVLEVIKERFKDLSPERITHIRLRASDKIPEPIDFYYYFTETEV